MWDPVPGTLAPKEMSKKTIHLNLSHEPWQSNLAWVNQHKACSRNKTLEFKIKDELEEIKLKQSFIILKAQV